MRDRFIRGRESPLIASVSPCKAPTASAPRGTVSPLKKAVPRPKISRAPTATITGPQTGEAWLGLAASGTAAHTCPEVGPFCGGGRQLEKARGVSAARRRAELWGGCGFRPPSRGTLRKRAPPPLRRAAAWPRRLAVLALAGGCRRRYRPPACLPACGTSVLVGPSWAGLSLRDGPAWAERHAVPHAAHHLPHLSGEGNGAAAALPPQPPPACGPVVGAGQGRWDLARPGPSRPALLCYGRRLLGGGGIAGCSLQPWFVSYNGMRLRAGKKVGVRGPFSKGGVSSPRGGEGRASRRRGSRPLAGRSGAFPACEWDLLPPLGWWKPCASPRRSLPRAVGGGWGARVPEVGPAVYGSQGEGFAVRFCFLYQQDNLF